MNIIPVKAIVQYQDRDVRNYAKVNERLSGCGEPGTEDLPQHKLHIRDNNEQERGQKEPEDQVHGNQGYAHCVH